MKIHRLWIIFFVAGMLWLPASVIAQQNDPGITIHVVQRGETLFRIAQSYGVTVDDLASLNGLVDPSNIQVGQRLLVPANAVAATEIPQSHVVQPGETLRSIADLYGLTVENLAAWNNIADPNSIFVGQVLNLSALPMETPSAVQAATPTSVSIAQSLPASTGASIVYTVQAGETLFRIATSYGLTVNDLVQANNITDPTLIYAGQQLIIPGVQAPQLALDLPPTVTALDILPLIFVEGQTGRIRLTTTVPMTVSGLFLDRGIAEAAEQGNTLHTILVGVPIFTTAGVYPFSLTLTDTAGQSTSLALNIQIVDGNYGSEYINLLADRTNLLDPTVENNEQTQVAGIMSNFTPTCYWNGPMGLPAAAPIVSPFGRKRAYDGGPFDHFHAGTDFGGAPGSPILAAAAGYVVFAGPLDVRGNATIIDHGWGVFTGYWHQTEQYVHVGDFVTAGQAIGTIGSTGRVTGPHLHWELWVNGVPVDPMQWVRQSFT
ncbi:MAG: LysM peptidoglycan-binding domain-containing protein, partial [Chloroflexota bacterium]